MAKAMRRTNAKPGLTGKSSFEIFFGRARREEEELRLAPGGATQALNPPSRDEKPPVLDDIEKEREALKDDLIQAKEERPLVTTLRPRRKAQMPKIGDRVLVFRPDPFGGAGHGQGKYSRDWYRVVNIDLPSLRVEVRKSDTAESTSWESLRNIRPFYG
ncbi:hypothetical protein Pmar_PMAR026635 [Perkinsus marinus ATCC 50983]|nr:hypothetical protein Pmar_PMAR026635 [Perkinsus marinus ATCC 50983]EER06107.1 hypothetical protein Pmar_PMAR026635 [Perkinsus marinus ATCC 50983]|eukprot:XP_002774291.1 hypothetical protein Pmar_PMAR026635 [Perkinsus marinus ATCC 50983]